MNVETVPEGTLATGKKIYFVSDCHLGLPNFEESLVREKHLVKWLDEVLPSMGELYLLGDIFDFWYEYRKVAPRHFVRFLGKLAQIADSGIPIHLFSGNHDTWFFDYLPTEIGLQVHHIPQIRTINGKRLFMAHGDGLGPGDTTYKMLKSVFRNPLAIWLFGRLHPNLAFAFGQGWSKGRRSNHDYQPYLGPDKEYLILFGKEMLEKEHFDYFVFGHRHIPQEYSFNTKSTYVNTGDWVHHFTYAEFDGLAVKLKQYTKPAGYRNFLKNAPPSL